MPWERIERLTSFVAGVMAVWAEDVPDVRHEIVLGTYERLIQGLPLDLALQRATGHARNMITRARVCGMTGRWAGLATVQVLGGNALRGLNR